MLFPLSGLSQATDNVDLQKMYLEDQNARMGPSVDWAELTKSDSVRERSVYRLLISGQLMTGKDYYYSSMILQHGKDSMAARMTVKLVELAIKLDSTLNKWMLAAAIDQDLMRKNEPQIYGTQYNKKGANAKWERYRIDSTQVTDEQRKYYHVETLAEQKIKERELNLLSISEFYSKSNSLENAIKLIQVEIKKGNASAYNVSESDLNSFGYELLKVNKAEDALKVFKLNTELYPNGFNTFDSYGECLMLLKKKDEAIKAYKKSLALNPENAHALKIVREQK
jgi:tetratricopeptide (TPR) repeat protein